MAKGQTRYQDLAKYTRGVLFFGTPHKGSELAGLGTVLANFLRLSSLGASTNVQLVRDLARNSAKLEQVSDAFLQHGSSLKVITFYELEMMDMMSSLVRRHREHPQYSMADGLLTRCRWSIRAQRL
jgi:hypothetical protein